MSGKALFLAVSVVLFGAALFVFFRKSDSKIVVQELQQQPKIKLIQYEFYRVQNDVETNRIVGKQADLMEGNLLLLKGGVRGTRMRDGRREEWGSDYADINLASSHPGMLSGDLEVEKAKLYEDVEVSSDNLRLKTEQMTYVESEKMLRSPTAVFIQEGPQWTKGASGFQYNLATGQFRMTGGVSGLLFPNEIQARQKKRR